MFWAPPTKQKTCFKKVKFSASWVNETVNNTNVEYAEPTNTDNNNTIFAAAEPSEDSTPILADQVQHGVKRMLLTCQ